MEGIPQELVLDQRLERNALSSSVRWAEQGQCKIPEKGLQKVQQSQ